MKGSSYLTPLQILWELLYTLSLKMLSSLNGSKLEFEPGSSDSRAHTLNT